VEAQATADLRVEASPRLERPNQESRLMPVEMFPRDNKGGREQEMADVGGHAIHSSLPRTSKDPSSVVCVYVFVRVCVCVCVCLCV
jgi:hypothetical protein